MTYRPRRSMLYMPASNSRALEKAKTLKADGFVFDLEDAVGPDEKDIARKQACEAVKSDAYGGREIVVRMNSHFSEWGPRDIEAISKAGPDAVLVPKVNSAEDIRSLSIALNHWEAPEKTKLWVMIETPLAILNLKEIAEASTHPESRLSCFVLGTNDLAKETRAHMTADRIPFISWLSSCVVAAKAFGLCVLDSVYNDFKNVDGFRGECQQGLELGMDGKTLIHPSQIDVANEIFSPSEEEVAWSRRIVEAFDKSENANKGVISIDGRMVERLHADMAQQVVGMADAIQAMNAQDG